MSKKEDRARYLAKLCRQAEDLGADTALALPSSEIVIDERTSLKCQVPLCRSCGVNLMCPPNVMPVAQFREVVARYQVAVLLTVDIALDGISPENGADEGKARLASARQAKLKLHGIINTLEAACTREGYHFAAGLGCGACSLCEECVGVASGLPCRHPFRARPSMEAVGIDVMETAGRAGLDLTFGPHAGRSWVGLLLVD